LDLEKQYWQALKDGDKDVIGRLTDDPCIIAGASGVASINPSTLKQMIDSANYTLTRFELGDEITIHRLSDDIAILAYKVHEELIVDGKPVVLEAADTSVWSRRGGHWVCALHTESILGDAYGRDRKPMT